MYTLCCTRPLLTKLAHLTPPGGGQAPAPTTLLGDWYANRLNIGRHRLVLCTNERTLLCVVVPAKDLPNLSRRLVESLVPLLQWCGVPPEPVAREVREMAWVRFDRTASRSVLGSMNEMVFQADVYFRDPGRDEVRLDDLDRYLATNICSALQYRFPREAVVQLFARQGEPRI